MPPVVLTPPPPPPPPPSLPPHATAPLPPPPSPRCGPCKLFYPKLVSIAESMPDVAFIKLNMETVTPKVADELGVKAMPTLHLYK